MVKAKIGNVRNFTDEACSPTNKPIRTAKTRMAFRFKISLFKNRNICITFVKKFLVNIDIRFEIMAERKGKLYLLPTPISDDSIDLVIPQKVIDKSRTLTHFVVEEFRTARRYLSKIKVETPIDELTFFLLNEHTPQHEIENFLKPLKNGIDMGLMSEAGLPAVADPGSLLVEAAHRNNIEVVPMVGPNSLLLTLMASGLNGQNFAFIGYLPVKPDLRKKKIRELEQKSRLEFQTQLFIEAPYRNAKLFNDILNVCHDQTRLTIACELTSSNQFIKTKTIKEWKKEPLPEINKRNTVFAILF
jgi:16S rRNA (cytidine1402-2'-O)-methyltransferase